MIAYSIKRWVQSRFVALLGGLVILGLLLLFFHQITTTMAVGASPVVPDLDDQVAERQNQLRPAATCTVTSTADSGAGTLRWCLSQAGFSAYSLRKAM